MKLCKNCRTINTDDVKACVRCKMRDQLVSYNPEKTESWKKSMSEMNAVSSLTNVCRNCGTPDYGKNSRCRKCSFPLAVKRE